MPAVINLDYELPERKNENDSVYITNVVDDIRNTLTKIDIDKEKITLKEVLDIVKKTYVSGEFNSGIHYRINFSKAKELLKEYQTKGGSLDELLEKAGQFLLQ
mgnify:FL=1